MKNQRLPLFLLFVTVSFLSGSLNAQDSKNIILELHSTYTDKSGRFGLKFDEEKPVVGVVASIRNIHENWYSLYSTAGTPSRIAWTNRGVSGFINSSDFRNQPVKIIVFIDGDQL